VPLSRAIARPAAMTAHRLIRAVFKPVNVCLGYTDAGGDTRGYSYEPISVRPARLWTEVRERFLSA
jgi:hypothetical protein